MRRTIKSFVIRAGRMSNRQQQALDKDLHRYQLPMNAGPWDLKTIFPDARDVVVEIGFGMGTSLITMAEKQSKINFIGIEVHKPGIGSLVAALRDKNINNVRIVTADAVEVFKHQLRDHVLTGVQIFFPDPWPKKRHHKRRLIQPDFIRSILKRIKVGGFIHCATDWQDYAEHMRVVLNAEENLINIQPEDGFAPRPDRPLTKFEERGQRLGHPVWDLIYRKAS